jgi:hypothetical protein
MAPPKKWKHNPAYNLLREYGWDFLDIFGLQGVVILRQGKDVQMGAVVNEGQKLSTVLRELAERCGTLGNKKKMTNVIQVVEHTRLNNGNLMHILHREHNKMDIAKNGHY